MAKEVAEFLQDSEGNQIVFDAFHNYSTEERVVGKWINGADVYEKVYPNINKSVDYNTWTDIGVPSPSTSGKVIGATLINDYGDIHPCSITIASNNIKIIQYRVNNAVRVDTLIVRYIK